MARPLRIEFAGALYYVTSRCNAQVKSFENEIIQDSRSDP
jgi:hypothetical protein